jgi:lipoprotein-anchoring transpeptidase ErfK/SrfK
LVVDVRSRHLYYVQAGSRAIRFGVAVGREGASWRGQAVVGRKAKWPSWTPTANMRRRNPKLPIQVKGGPENPLGARALYLFQNGRDTLYRIHGTNEPWSIGKAASSGCIRMLNEDVFELYGSVAIGARVFVR